MSDIPLGGGMSGPYRLIRVVGRGGMGIVHEAWDTRLDRRVALKMLHAHLLPDRDASARFEREARKSARIEHPNVVRIYRVDTVEERTAIEMQFIDGAPLNSLLRSGPLSPVQGADLLRQLLDALQACHEQGVIHCDLKPGNLLVTRDGRVVLTDFGIARALYSVAPDATRDPVSGALWGTPQYSPPESWRGEPVSPRWDLFAAGVLVYEAITGLPAFHGASPAALMHAILSTSPPPLKVARPEITGAMSDLVDSLMAREPAARPTSAREALDLLRRTPERSAREPETQPIPSHPPPAVGALSEAVAPTPAVSREPHRTWMPIVLLAVVLLTTAAVIKVQWPAKDDTGRALVAPSQHDPLAAELLVAGDAVYFAADDGVRGRELWTLDEGKEPRLVSDIVPGPGSSNPRHFKVRRPGNIVFAAFTPDTGEELWYGQSGDDEWSARLIRDIIPGQMGSAPKVVAMEDTLVLFYATTLGAGRELWCTNALSEQQTALVTDLYPGVDGSQPTNIRVYAVSGGAYVVALSDGDRGCVLFRYDFATNTMREVGDVGEDAGAMTMLGHRLLFANTDEAHGWELWVYDENTREFGLLADMWPGVNSSGPSQFYTWGDRALFQARTGVSGSELWISDGTAAGTNLLADIDSGPNDGDPYGFVAAGDFVFFRARDKACGRELWVTDATGPGTRRVADMMPGPDSGEPYNLVAHEQYFYFSANDGIHGEELWWLDLATDSWEPTLMADLYPGRVGSEPYDLQFASDGYAYFVAKSPHDGSTVVKVRPAQSTNGAWLYTGPEATITPLQIGPGNP